MSRIEHYRELYSYEKDCNPKMLAMIESVPEANRSDVRFQQAVTLAGHASCHRGQIALLVDQLGGETVDTDYVYWAVPDSA